MSYFNIPEFNRMFLIWYYEAWLPSFANRGGIRYCNLVETDLPFDPSKCQSIAEHELGTRSLVDSFLMFFPEFFGLTARDEKIVSRIAGMHDLPEALLDGDIVADGLRRDDVVEDARELDKFMDFSNLLVDSNRYLSFYSLLQSQDTSLGWMLHMADKTEAILTVTMYPTAHLGAVDLHEVSKMTEHQMDASSSNLPYECWLVSLIDEMHGSPKYKDISEIFLKVIIECRAAAVSLRGGLPVQPYPLWLDDYDEARRRSTSKTFQIV